MGKQLRAVGTLIKADGSLLFRSAKLYVVLLAVAVGLMSCFGGIRAYLARTGALINPLELFAVCISNKVSLWIVFIGMVALIADVPFRRKGDVQSVLRMGRRSWLSAQLIFALLSLSFYLAFLILFFFALTFGYWTIASGWSEVFCQAAYEGSDSVGIVFGITFWQPFLNSSPAAEFGHALWLTLLSGSVITVLLTWFQLCHSPKAGHVLCAVLPMVDYLLSVEDYPWCKTAAAYLSPFSLTMPSFLQPINGDGKTIAYAGIYLGTMIAILLLAIFRRVKRYDFYTA